MSKAILLWIALAIVQQASCRVVPTTGALLTQRQLRQASTPEREEATPDITQLSAQSKRVFVVLVDSVDDVTAAAEVLVSDVRTAMAAVPALRGGVATAGAGPVGVDEQVSLVRSLGNGSAGPAAAATAAMGGSNRSGLRSVVLNAPETAIAHLKAHRLVKTVLHDRVVVHQAISCVEARYLATGLTATPSASFKWPECMQPSAKLLWFGKACSSSKVLYTEVRAVNWKTGAVLRTKSGSQCILAANAAKATWNKQRFGSCGTAPMYAKTLPTQTCSATGGNPTGGNPNSGAATSPAPSTSNGGGSGSGNTAGTPTQVLPPTVLPRIPLAAGERIPTSGIARIEAASAAGGVFKTAGLPTGQQVVVGLVDSGVDGSHPDLNLVGGAAWVTPSTNLADDKADFDYDRYGHGTHVAGIVGAKNNGAGVVGVAPGLPLFSLKVLDGEGVGSLSDAMAAVEWAAGPEGQAKGIKVINLSLAAYVDPTASDYADIFNLVCNSFKIASDAGLVVVAAAGNYQANIAGYFPASCPTVVAVTSMDSGANGVSSFSNYLPVDAPGADKARVIAAPGSGILSTMSYNRDASGYRELSGTSFASPHVAGVAATCLMSASCQAGVPGIAQVATIQAAAAERLTLANVPAYGFQGDASSSSRNGKYVGNLVWAKY